MQQKPELVFALAGPIGTDLHLLAQTLEESLRAYHYDCTQIRVSSLITQWCNTDLQSRLDSEKQDIRIKLLMGAGDAIRAQAKKGDGLVPIIAAAIRTIRESKLKEMGLADSQSPLANTCFIIDSLKHPDEVESLRNLYGDNFILISGFSSLQERQVRLSRIIAKSYISTKDELYKASADDLIERDAKRSGGKLGQSLRDTFPLGDLFIRVTGDFSTKLNRFLDLYFSSPYVTPKRDEYFMYEAKAKAFQSADLSRQIGAVVVGRNNHLIAAGCNEVPIAGGGTYWPDMEECFDNRDYKQERDFNAVKKVEIIEELLSFLAKMKVVSLPEGETIESVVRSLLFGNMKGPFRDLRVSNLIEFGRVVHAEMNALSTAARLGLAVGDGTIYSTTFPCHMCAKHIIAAGIRRVVYIEPYPKSMTQELYGPIVTIDADSVPSEDGREPNEHVVSFEPFEGVAPNLYRDLFQAGPRKDPQGYTLEWSRSTAVPKVARVSTAHLNPELLLAKAVEQLDEVSLEDVSQGAEGERDVDNQRRNSGSDSA